MSAAPQARGAAQGKLLSIQALRGVAALMVVLIHLSTPFGTESRYLAGPQLTHWLQYPALGGIDLFFVISGVIITITTWRSFSTDGAFRRFAYRRLTRIYPVYWIVTTVVLVVWLIHPGLVNSHSSHPTQVAPSFLILPQAGDPLVATGWTLVYELYFYTVFAFTLLLGRRWLPWIMAAWVALTLGLHAAVAPTHNPYLGVVANPLIIEFVMGVFIGWLVMTRVLVAPRTLLALGAAGVAATVAYRAATGAASFTSIWFEVFAVGLAMAVFVYAAIGMEMRRGSTPSPAAVRLGDASYSLYLSHVLVLSATALVLGKILPHSAVLELLALLLIVAAAVAAGLLLYAVVERPLLRAFHTRRFGAAVPAPREAANPLLGATTP